jgi:hypothetical protein
MRFFDGFIKGLLRPDPGPPTKRQILLMLALVAFITFALSQPRGAVELLYEKPVCAQDAILGSCIVVATEHLLPCGSN